MDFREIPTLLRELPPLHVLATGPVCRPGRGTLRHVGKNGYANSRRSMIESCLTRHLCCGSPTHRRWRRSRFRIACDARRNDPRSGADSAREILLRINAHIAGVVVNDVDVRLENNYTKRNGMYGYGGRYGPSCSDCAYGYEDEDEEAK
jgi:hypothetical protein